MALFRRDRSESEKRAALERLIVEEFARAGRTGEVIRDPDDPLNTRLRSTDGALFGFSNLLLRALPEPEKSWRSIVRAHVATTVTPPDDVDLTTPGGRTLLRARIMPAGFAEMLPLTYARPFAPGLIEVFCLDLPDKVSTVSDPDLVGLDVDELRAIARRNLQSEQIESRDEVSAGITLLEGSSMFVASQLLNPEFLPLEVGAAPRGVVVAIPDRHLLFHHAVQGADSAGPISRLAGYVAKIDRDERPGGLLSAHTYWVPPAGAASGIQQITRFGDDGSVQVHVDGGFAEALEG